MRSRWGRREEGHHGVKMGLLCYRHLQAMKEISNHSMYSMPLLDCEDFGLVDSPEIRTSFPPQGHL